MPPAARKFPPKAAQQTPAQQHEEWLQLLRPDGPFIALPVLTEVLPQGLDTVETEQRARIRQAWAEVQEDPALLGPAWQQLITGELLGWTPGLREGAAIPEALRAGENTPDAVLLGPGGPDGPQPRVLLYRADWGEPITRARKNSPALTARAADLCRWRGVPLALVTNGREWALVHARPKEAETVAVFDADLWLEEPLLLRSFATLLHARRAALPPLDKEGKDTTSLAALFARTANRQSEVTDTLGRQVRDAVALLVAEVSRLDRESGGELLGAVPEKSVYEAALTVMMRLVFLLYAEEQRLLPAEDSLYSDSYAVSPMHDLLQTDQSLHGGEIGDRRKAAWPRLLAVFAALHAGSTHPDLWIPAYGGSLFDPARFPWLADAKVTDRVVYEILDALLTLRRPGKGREALSYKGLDVEQIGHVYEGLLEYGCVRADRPYVGLTGKYEAVLPLPSLEAWREEGAGVLERELKEASGATPKQIQKALATEPDLAAMADLDAACDNDEALAQRVAPFFGLVRSDLRGQPMVFPAGSVVMVRSGDRRNTGTHYTPKNLAEEVVEHTLAPLCYSPGPAEGVPADGVWRAKSADELLKLKVLDPAMGSGAFLVSACRYLADRVVEAWERDGLPDDVRKYVADDDHDELLRVARRLVADRCLYGVDRDAMAVELAKLSLWLVTLAKGRPFSFLDHALRCGDSLVGTIDIEQIKAFSLDSEARQISDEVGRALDVTETLLSRAAELRREIEAMPVLDIRDARAKADKLKEAESLAERLRLAADAVVGAALAAEGIDDAEAEDLSGERNVGGNRASFRAGKEDAKATAYENRLAGVAGLVARALEEDGDVVGSSTAGVEARAIVDGWLKGERAAAVRPLHWPLEFPEIMGVGGAVGFDVVVGNPPFSGGKKLTTYLGNDYREYLVNRIGSGVRGNADLCSYFLLRNLSLAPGKRTGIIATNSIAQNQTREVGLDQATDAGWTVYRAIKSQPWPGTAALEVSLLWLGRTDGREILTLDGRDVHGITSALDPVSRVSGRPHTLAANIAQSFQGVIVLGKGFVLGSEEAEALIERDPRNADALFPYLNGEDLNSRHDFSAGRWVIDFHDWSEGRAREYPDLFAIVEREVKPAREKAANGKEKSLRWWQHWRRRPEMLEAIKGLERVVAIARVSSTVAPALVSAKQVLNEKLVVFASDRPAKLALLSSTIHVLWAWKYSSTLKADLQYTPSGCFETFPQPELNDALEEVGVRLERVRRDAMTAREVGLTKLYSEVHDPSKQVADIARIRATIAEVDQAVAEAYGWTDLDLGHGFHETRQGTRYTILPAVQTEILDRLLELNNARYAEEVKAGLHTPKAKKAASPAGKKRQAEAEDTFQDGLFAQPDALF
ncbi:DNA methyltransferase [Streptomyces sp. NPDC048277]|uniref:Eco57I restriction-modification methylase domain-containing protein n=1 Tax=Streptomyces sp. NPDC048277 TaxID=3155027 RepID=UPI003407FD27